MKKIVIAVLLLMLINTLVCWFVLMSNFQYMNVWQKNFMLCDAFGSFFVIVLCVQYLIQKD